MLVFSLVEILEILHRAELELNILLITKTLQELSCWWWVSRKTLLTEEDHNSMGRHWQEINGGRQGLNAHLDEKEAWFGRLLLLERIQGLLPWPDISPLKEWTSGNNLRKHRNVQVLRFRYFNQRIRYGTVQVKWLEDQVWLGINWLNDLEWRHCEPHSNAQHHAQLGHAQR